MLVRKLKSGSKVAILDLLDFDDDHVSGIAESIPGALRLDPARLRNSPRISVPNDVQIVLYCSSRRDVMSAQVAIALQKIGVQNVWVLEGGLRGWREEGYPVSQNTEPPEIVASRFGVTLPHAV